MSTTTAAHPNDQVEGFSPRQPLRERAPGAGGGEPRPAIRRSALGERIPRSSRDPPASRAGDARYANPSNKTSIPLMFLKRPHPDERPSPHHPTMVGDGTSSRDGRPSRRHLPFRTATASSRASSARSSHPSGSCRRSRTPQTLFEDLDEQTRLTQTMRFATPESTRRCIRRRGEARSRGSTPSPAAPLDAYEPTAAYQESANAATAITVVKARQRRAPRRSASVV